MAEHPMRVLLVEDDDGDALYVGELLDLAEAEVELVRARTLAEGRRLVLDQFDCILLDLQLPDGSGDDAVREALAWEDGASALVVLTGNVDESVGYRAVELGAQDYLVKSKVDESTLVRSLRYAISRHRVDEQARHLLEAQLRRSANDRIERGLLPLPHVRSDDVSIVSRYRPGGGYSALGGDFVDAVETDDGALRAVIGDVAGHGPEEAALGVSLRIAWRTLVLAGHDPDEVLRSVERLLVAERPDDGIFVTVLDLEINTARTELTIRQGGHPAPFLLRPKPAVLELPCHGPALGLFDPGSWPAQAVPLEPGWGLIAFTDGLIEGHDNGDGRLGAEGVLDLLRAIGAADRDDHGAMCDELLAAVSERHGGPLPDDVAVLLLADRRPS